MRSNISSKFSRNSSEDHQQKEITIEPHVNSIFTNNMKFRKQTPPSARQQASFQSIQAVGQRPRQNSEKNSVGRCPSIGASSDQQASVAPNSNRFQSPKQPPKDDKMTTINLQNQVQSQLKHMPLIIGAKGIPKIKVKPVVAKQRPQTAEKAQHPAAPSLNICGELSSSQRCRR